MDSNCISANKSGQEQQPPPIPVNAAEFKRRMSLMRRWLSEFSDAQRTAAMQGPHAIQCCLEFHGIVVIFHNSVLSSSSAHFEI